MSTRTRITQVASTGIAAVAVGVSYGQQVDLLRHWHMATAAAIAIPLTVDLLALVANVARTTPGMDRSDRRLAGWVLAIAGAASIGANVVHGTNIVIRIASVWCVLAYLLSEQLVDRTARAITRRRTAVAPQAAPVSPAAPVPAPMVAEIEQALAPAAVALWPKQGEHRTLRRTSQLKSLNPSADQGGAR